MIIRRATLLDGRIVDVRVGARIEEVGDGLAARSNETVLDAGGGTLLPGLHDHHAHVRAAASALHSLAVGPPAVTTEGQLRQALSNATPGSDGWIRAVGYHESVAGPLDRAALDAVVPHMPVRVQHRSGALWTLNSAALHRIGLADHVDGRLRSADPGWSGAVPQRPTDLAGLSDRLVALGVTGVTDATPDLSAKDAAALTQAHRRGEFRPTLKFLAPGKKILHDDHLDLDALTAWIATQHRAGRLVAVHCVSAAQLLVTIAALRTAGSHPGDRIEHAAVVPDDSLADLAELGLTVVTQPNFVAERGDQYLTDVPEHEHQQLWRVASLRDAEVPVALSTDMPFGPFDPWAVMRAAVHRTTPSGVVLNPRECIDAATALTMFTGHPEQPARPRTIAAGQPAQLCLLSQPPAAALAELDAAMVTATIIGGEVAYRAT